MIRVLCQGGLGNQLFQYATARRLAMLHGAPLVVDPDWFGRPRPDETPRRYELGRYPLPLRFASLAEQRICRLARGWAGRLLAPLLPFDVVRERGLGSDLPRLQATRNAYLIGYWQSESYFADIRPTLLQELKPAEPLGEDRALADRMASCASVSVHVRRGDYVSSINAASFHGSCSLDYYADAIALIAARLEGAELFVFSDDPEWCRTHLRAPLPTHHVSGGPAADPHRDLWMMARCRHHVIANSSFSWWGAWLGEPADTRIVIAPQRWFAAGLPTPDHVPARWIRL